METLLRYGLLAVFCALLLAPFGLPIPEDVSLLVAGVLVQMGEVDLPSALVVGYLGVLIGDAFVWTLGRNVGLGRKSLLSRLAGPRSTRRIESFFNRWGQWAIVICRNFPGLRFPAFFFAGASGVPLHRFLLLDGMAAMVTVGLYIWLGHKFADNLDSILPWLDHVRALAAMVVTVVLGVVAFRFAGRVRRRREAKRLGLAFEAETDDGETDDA